MEQREERRPKKHVPIERISAWTICIAAGAVGGWLAFRYVPGIALPFALAYLLSLCIRPVVRRMTARRRIPRALVAGTLVILLVGATVGLTAWGVSRALSELGRLVESLADENSDIMITFRGALDWMLSLSEHLPFLKHFEDTPGFADFCAQLDAFVLDAANRLLEELGNRLPGMAINVIGAFPSAFLFITVLLLSCYYFSADDGRLGRAFISLLPSPVASRLSAWLSEAKHLIGRYFRAYLILGVITFVEMFIGLTIIGISYAFLLALVIAVVDFLPLFGAGTVLVPWASVLLITGNYHDGIGLLILFGISLLIRQIAEPRLISAGLGLHPLVSLMVMYAGWKLFGLVGMLVAPLVAGCVQQIWRNHDGTKSTPK